MTVSPMDPRRLAIFREAAEHYAEADDGCWEAIIAEHATELIAAHDDLLASYSRMRDLVRIALEWHGDYSDYELVHGVTSAVGERNAFEARLAAAREVDDG